MTLDLRIRLMAQRWRYSPEDLAEALASAASDPDGWLAAVEVDELLAAAVAITKHNIYGAIND